jgi:hypothetical protein
MTTNDPITLTAGEAAKVLGLARSTLAKLRVESKVSMQTKAPRDMTDAELTALLAELNGGS